MYQYAADFEISGKTTLTLQRVTTLGLDKGKDTVNDEEFLERFFIWTHNDLYNHLSFKGKNSIDLVRVNDQGCITGLIELKKDSNNLYHAFYEVIFYYFLLCRTKNKIKDEESRKITVSDTLNLIVLLPEKLYKQHDKYNEDKEEFKEQLQRELTKLNKKGEPTPVLHITQIYNDNPFMRYSKNERIKAYKNKTALYHKLWDAISAIELP